MGDTQERVFQYPLAIIGATIPDDLRGLVRSREELRALAVERRAFDEAGLQKYEPFFFTAEISNNRLDSHYTRMAQSTLKNYAQEAEGGVSFLYSHDCAEIVGRSMSGRFVGGQGDGVARVLADFYVVTGLQLGTIQSDQIIRAIDSGVLSDVSVGFYGGEWICSICGNDIWEWEECSHYPGMNSKVQADGETREQMCTADVEDAHLAEASGVYKGSTPGAMIAKATRQAKDGSLEPKTRLFLERHLRIHLPEKRVSVPGHSEKENMSTAAEDQNKPNAERATQAAMQPEVDAAQVRSLLTEAGFAEGDISANLRALAEQAADGRAYRKSLITEAIAEGVRANGADFKTEEYERTLQGLPLDTIRTMKGDWSRIAKEKFPGGRQTEDGEEQVAEARKTTGTPDAAFAA
jgi:hypothetical protein